MNDEPTTTPAPVTTALRRDPRAQIARAGLLGIASAALIAAALLLLGATTAPGGILAADNDGSWSAGGNARVEALHGFRGGPGGRAFGHGPGGGITVTAISGSAISLETVDGWTRTITVDDSTELSKGGDEITLADLAVGDEVAFRQTREDDGSWTIEAIAVLMPHVGGRVTAADGSTVTVERRDGTSATINVDDGTEITVDGDEATLADIEVGMFLFAEGLERDDGSLDATRLRAADPDAFGGPGRHGFRFGPDVDRAPDGGDPDATEAPSSAGGAS